MSLQPETPGGLFGGKIRPFGTKFNSVNQFVSYFEFTNRAAKARKLWRD